MMYRKFNTLFLSLATIAFVTVSCVNKQGDKKYENAVDIPVNQEMQAELTAPPLVPTPVGKRMAKKLIVDMEILELEGTMTEGVTYVYWTFDGTVPGSFIRTRVGDEIEFHLKNHPQNKLPHNIDLHAVNGPGGGAVSSLVAPGHQTVFSFKVLNPGLYVYHCATAPVGMHIANGMYGLILVEPEGGLPPVDREFYVMQSEFYTAGRYGAPGHQPFDMEKALEERPEYVVFNGKVGALTGESALHADVGDTVRLYIGNGGPNLVSSFHAIGEIFDAVHVEAGSTVNRNVQTTLIPAGGASIVDFRIEVPGQIVLVDHSIFRAFNKGAIASIEVSGEPAPEIYTGQQKDIVYKLEGGIAQSMPGDAPPEPQSYTPSERVSRGREVYSQVCAACHMPEGQGVPGAFPPLAGSDYLNEDPIRAARVV